jgi:subtilisin-like proprotein convertase family protein
MKAAKTKIRIRHNKARNLNKGSLVKRIKQPGKKLASRALPSISQRDKREAALALLRQVAPVIEAKPDTLPPQIHVNPTPVHVDPTPFYVNPTPVHVDPTPINFAPMIHVAPTPVNISPQLLFAPFSIQSNRTVSTTRTFANPTEIALAGNNSASHYPSTITVTGLSGVVSRATVTLYNTTHPSPSDVSALLVSPGNLANTLLLSNTGGRGSVSDTHLTFDDKASDFIPPGSIASGTYKPTNYGATDGLFPAPAPSPSRTPNLGAFNGTDPNGDWNLYVAGAFNASAGSIANGWSLTLTTEMPEELILAPL